MPRPRKSYSQPGTTARHVEDRSPFCEQDTWNRDHVTRVQPPHCPHTYIPTHFSLPRRKTQTTTTTTASALFCKSSSTRKRGPDNTMTSNTHLAALLALLLGTAAQSDAHRYRTHHNHNGRRLFHPSFETATAEAFRPFQAPPRGSGLFTSAGPLVDVFQEVMSDVKRGEPLETNCCAGSVWISCLPPRVNYCPLCRL